MAKLADFLDKRVAEIISLEHAGEKALDQKDVSAYRTLMLRKAEILSRLAEDAAPYVPKAPAGEAAEVAETIEAYSRSAASALRLKSVFYMSALLFDDDHKKGEPNNLELLARNARVLKL